VTTQHPTQVTSCCNLLAPVGHLSTNSRSARMYASPRATSVHCPALIAASFVINLILGHISRFSCAKEIENASSGEPFPWHWNCLQGCNRHVEKSEGMHRWTRWTFPALNIGFWFRISVQFIFWQIEYVRNRLCDFKSPCVRRELEVSGLTCILRLMKIQPVFYSY
jgi:hypothetical protein